MSVLLRGAELVGRPVVTLEGELLCEVKDVLVHRGEGRLLGFTLRDTGLLGGPRKDALNWESVHALGRDAVMVDATASLPGAEEVVARTERRGTDVLADRVLTDTGTELGTVTDVVLSVSDGPAGRAEVVGYELAPSEAMGTGSRTVLLPLPAALAVSGENLVVPDAAREFVAHDLAGFGASVDAFRSRLQAGTTSTRGAGGDA